MKDAVQFAEPDTSSLPRGQVKQKNVNFAPRVEAALVALLEAREYADELETSYWDFAVELPQLRQLGISRSDLRWLAGRGLVETAIEVTLGGDACRSFRRPPRLLFCKKACFVLTPIGAEAARKLRDNSPSSSISLERSKLAPTALAIAATPEPLVPKWDRDRQELKIGSVVIKQFKVPAANQETILAAFEEEGWPARIDDPLPPHDEQSPKRRLQETIKSLNRNQKRPLLRFLGDGSGQGVRWEFRDGSEAPGDI